MIEEQAIVQFFKSEVFFHSILYFFAFLIAWKAFGKWQFHHFVNGLHGKYRDNVLLYTATWSVKGNQVQELLKQQLVTFTKLDTDISEEAHNELKKLGIRGLPVLIIDGHIIKGLQPEKVFRLLAKHQSI